jgi:RimJ/RimL family protein N-acetyltransferase
MTTRLSAARADPGVTRVYGWVDTRNRESQMLLRLLGFKDVQRVKRVHVARRLGHQLPRSDKPRFGPLSARGRHSGASDDRAA